MEKILKLIWDTLVSISLIIIVLALVFEFIWHPSKEFMHLFHDIEIFALSFLFMELLYDFYKADDKKKFITKEWLLILSFLPLGTILRLARFFKSSRIVKALDKVWISIKGLLRLEQTSVKTAQTTVHATKASRLLRPIAQFLDKKNERLNELRD